MENLLLLSNSTTFGGRYLDHAMAAIMELLGTAGELVFVPFAVKDHDAYTARVRERFAIQGIEVRGLDPTSGGARVLEKAVSVVSKRPRSSRPWPELGMYSTHLLPFRPSQ